MLEDSTVPEVVLYLAKLRSPQKATHPTSAVLALQLIRRLLRCSKASHTLVPILYPPRRSQDSTTTKFAFHGGRKSSAIAESRTCHLLFHLVRQLVATSTVCLYLYAGLNGGVYSTRSRNVRPMELDIGELGMKAGCRPSPRRWQLPIRQAASNAFAFQARASCPVRLDGIRDDCSCNSRGHTRGSRICLISFMTGEVSIYGRWARVSASQAPGKWRDLLSDCFITMDEPAIRPWSIYSYEKGYCGIKQTERPQGQK